jgi:hypothetical protein
VLHPTVRKTVCLLAKPIPTGDARREIRRQKVEYLTDAEHKARVGQVTDLSDRQEYQDILDREAEINVGHADMRFTGLIAITAADKAALDESLVPLETALDDIPALAVTGEEASRLRQGRALPAPRAGMTADDRAATHAAELFIPNDTPWMGRRARRRGARRLVLDARESDSAEVREQRKRARSDQQAVDVVPRPGEPGPAALHCYRRFRLPPHRATTAVLAYAYPFLAEAGLGSAGVLIGRDTYSSGSFVYDPWMLYRDGAITNPNVLLAGVIGTGKSALAKSVTTRSLAFGRRVYVPGDPKGEWTSVATAVGGAAIQLGPGLSARLNPLDAGSRPSGLDDQGWRRLVWQRRRDLLGSLTETVLGRRFSRPSTPPSTPRWSVAGCGGVPTSHRSSTRCLTRRRRGRLEPRSAAR